MVSMRPAIIVFSNAFKRDGRTALPASSACGSLDFKSSDITCSLSGQTKSVRFPDAALPIRVLVEKRPHATALEL